MFCKNCGNQIIEGDKFCGSCGQNIDNTDSQRIVTPIKMKDSALLELLKKYFIKPVSFFSELKDKDLLKTSIALLIALPVINGLLNILYNSAVVSSIFSLFKKLPNILAEAGIITKGEALQGQTELFASNQFINFKDKIDNLIDNKEIFLSGSGQILIIMILTGIILGILNAIILKSKIKATDILFISTVSYIPLVLAMVVAIIATFISILFGLFILFSGYILSFITLYSGIRQLSNETNDKAFILMTILFVLISAVLSICIVLRIDSSIMSIMNTFNTLKGFV